MPHTEICFDCRRPIDPEDIVRREVRVGGAYISSDGTPNSHGRFVSQTAIVSLCLKCNAKRDRENIALGIGCLLVIAVFAGGSVLAALLNPQEREPAIQDPPVSPRSQEAIAVEGQTPSLIGTWQSRPWRDQTGQQWYIQWILDPADSEHRSFRNNTEWTRSPIAAWRLDGETLALETAHQGRVAPRSYQLTWEGPDAFTLVAADGKGLPSGVGEGLHFDRVILEPLPDPRGGFPGR